MTKHLSIGVVLALATLVAAPASAQLNGENLLGDTGVKNGSQAAPGTYVGLLYYRYSTDTIRNKNGDVVSFDPSQPGSEVLHAVMPLFIYVTHKKVLGANYGMMTAMPFANATLEAPGFGFDSDVGEGPADLYVVPLQLGWHMPRADVISAFGLFAPTGRYTAGANRQHRQGDVELRVLHGHDGVLRREEDLERRDERLLGTAFEEGRDRQRQGRVAFS